MVGGEAGKGDTYRPVNQRRYAENFERIFRKNRRRSRRKESRGPDRIPGLKKGDKVFRSDLHAVFLDAELPCVLLKGAKP